MTARTLAPYLGALDHPRGEAAVFDQTTGLFRSPRRGSDHPETERAYEFNSLGFRGSEYDPNAPFRVFVCGCSYTFGMGVDTDETWPVVFTRLAAAELGVPVERSLVQNFSQIGASNNYLARTLVKQCDLAPPTLAIAAFTHVSRTEYLDGKELINLGYWNIGPDRLDPAESDSPGKRFFRQYSHHSGLQNLLVNMIFFQKAMESRGIPYIVVRAEKESFEGIQEKIPIALSDYYQVLDKSRISRASIRRPGIRVDTADRHPGPQSHERFAQALASEFRGRLLESRAEAISCGPSPPNPGRCRSKRTSAARLTRALLRNTATKEPTCAHLMFTDTLAVEHFIGDQPVEIDVERRVWKVSTAYLQTAYAEYVTADVLRFNFWLNVLMAQEFVRAHGRQLKVTAPEHWLPRHGQCPVLQELLDLLIPVSFHPVRTLTNQSGDDAFAIRLDRAKRRLRRSPIVKLLRRYGGGLEPSRRDDHNIYPLW